jgi:hypothetical protein
MALTEDLDICGHLTATLHRGSGEPVAIRRVNNSIALTGRDLVTRLFNGNQQIAIKKVTQMRMDTNGTAFDAKQTNLLTPIGSAVDIKTYEILTVDETTKIPRKKLRLTTTLSEAQYNGKLQEAGLFTADNVMYNRVVFAPINKSDQFKLTLTWEITF